jgi:hypothetical protein
MDCFVAPLLAMANLSAASVDYAIANPPTAGGWPLDKNSIWWLSMKTSSPNPPHPSIDPPGISSDYLIEPAYVRALSWGLYCIKDRLTLRQIAILSGTNRGSSGNVYGSFVSNGSREVTALDRDSKVISAYFAEMVGGDVCVYDLPNSFLICVLEGDLTLLAGAKEKMLKCVGSSEMNQAQWTEIISDLRNDLRTRLSTKYVTRRAASPEA